MKHGSLLALLPSLLLIVAACDEAPLDDVRLAAAEDNPQRAAGSCSPEACGEYVPANSCQCDDACVDYGDCCDDVETVCGDEPGDACASNDDCPEFCGWNEDNLRVCKPWAQVGESCEGFVLPSFRASCAPGLECDFPEPTFDVPGTCVEPCVPAGCSGQVCALQSEAPGVITTCEVLPEYICFGETSCGHHGTDGACAWEETEGYLECLAGFEEPQEPAADSCEGHCGDMAEAGCYCDDACAFWGDCCDDMLAVCG